MMLVGSPTKVPHRKHHDPFLSGTCVLRQSDLAIPPQRRRTNFGVDSSMVAGGADALAPRRNGCASYSPADRKAGYRYQISILQAGFSLTQVLDRPTAGRLLFEEIVRENLDIGRPSQVQLIFGRRVNTRSPRRFHTRPSPRVSFPPCTLTTRVRVHR